MDRKETITVIRSLLSSTNSSFGIYALNKEFKNETGIDIPLYGYSSLDAFLESIPDTVKLTGVYPIQKVSLVENNVSGHIVSLVKRQRKDKKSKKGTNVGSGGYFLINGRNSNRKVMKDKKLATEQSRQNSGGVQLQRVISRTQTHNRAEDTKSKPSQNKVEGQKQILQQKKHLKSENENCSLGAKKKTSEDILQVELSDDSEVVQLPSIVSNLLCIPDCFLREDESIPAYNLRLHAAVGRYVEVCPCEISHPGLFYLHLRKFKKELAKLMIKLQEFYNRHEEILVLGVTPKPKQICAVRYSRHGNYPRWHRVQIEEVLIDACLVVVRFVDYGTTAKVFIKNLKPLHRNFSKLPRQAVLGSSANIKPVGGGSEWSKSATKRFHELAFYRDLVGGVVSMDCDSYSLNLALSSTVGEEVHLNDTLVEERLAEFDVNAMQYVERPKMGQSAASGEGPDHAPPGFYTKNNINNNSRLYKMFDV